MKLILGDTVVLKSGGPCMRVECTWATCAKVSGIKPDFEVKTPQSNFVIEEFSSRYINYLPEL